MEISFLKLDDASFERIWNSIATDAAADSFPQLLSETAEAEWRDIKERWSRVMHEILLDEAPVGYIFLSPKKDETAHLGYGLYREFRGRGLMPTLALAFLEAELPRLRPHISALQASALPENKASQKTLRRLGFTLIGEVQQDELTYLRFSRLLDR